MKRFVCVFSVICLLALGLAGCGGGAGIPESPAEDFSYEMQDGQIVITGYTGTDREIRVPAKINDRPVRVIGEEAFAGYDMTYISLPDSVSAIVDGAFENCVCLEKIDLSENVLMMGKRVFSGCVGLKSIELPKQLARLGTAAFMGCTSLESVDLPATLFVLEEDVFSGCSSLKKVHLSDGLMEIGSQAFMDCVMLADVTVPDSVQTIRSSAFSGCATLKEISLPTGLTTLDVWAFAGCTSLEKASLPETLTKIPRGVFNGCKAMKEVEFSQNATIQQGVVYVGRDESKVNGYTRIATVVTMWLPTYEYIKSYERTDLSARDALTKSLTEVEASPTIVVAENSPMHLQLKDFEKTNSIDLQEVGIYRVK